MIQLRICFLLESGKLLAHLHDRYVVLVRNVSHVGRSECGTVRSVGDLEHLFYESGDGLQFASDVLSLLNCAT